jgi:hypothetical protein
LWENISLESKIRDVQSSAGISPSSRPLCQGSPQDRVVGYEELMWDDGLSPRMLRLSPNVFRTDFRQSGSPSIFV